MPTKSREEFIAQVERVRAESDVGDRTIVVPVGIRMLSDQLTPVLAYRRLVAPDERTAHSFLLESVEGGERAGRHSILGARPRLEVLANHRSVRVDQRDGAPSGELADADPFEVLQEITESLHFVAPTGDERQAGLAPSCVLGGWFGYAGYDTVRYAEPVKLDPSRAPVDDRRLPDLHFGLYDQVVVFDHATKVVHAVQLVFVEEGADSGAVYDEAVVALERLAGALQTHSKPLPAGRIDQSGESVTPAGLVSNMTREQHAAMLAKASEYIRAGDIFQVVLGQRFERVSEADPFDVYRALRAVNPSPYMVYLQAEGCILVASSPEILCRVRHEDGDGGRVVTNRPLAGTRKRGATEAEDQALAEELLADEKERAEHIMLVDLGRNDVGKVCELASVKLERVMEIERYSHVMHISSTVTGELRAESSCWDALRATLPVGTISGAPKIRAMQIIDELEPVRRGPYGGGMGYVSLDGDMDIALALRTIVTPTARYDGARWTYHLQAAGGIVADSQPDAEYEETVNKSAALARAITLAERAFDGSNSAEG